MPLYICDCCGAVDNTACGGNFWIKASIDETKRETTPDLCCKCYTGKWHNKFPYELCTADVFKEIGEWNFVYWLVNNEPKPGPSFYSPRKEKYHPKHTVRSKTHMKKLVRGYKKKR